MNTAKPDYGNPLKGRVPLRAPGQSLDEEVLDTLVEGWLVPAVGCLFAILLIGSEWLQWYTKAPPNPIVVTVIGVPVFVWCAFRMRRSWAKLRALKLGRDGERIMAEDLGELMRTGADLFHDIKGDRFNLDHVVVSPKGIFVVETKTWNKPSGGRAIEITSEGLVAGGMRPDRDPIAQARAEGAWLATQIKAGTGKDFRVQPVVVFHGWWIAPEATAEAKRQGVWLLNPKMLLAWLRNEPTRLEQTDLRLVGYFLSRLARSK